MGLMDKVKAQAQNVAAQAKNAAGQAQDKMEQVQLRKKADEAAKQLGYLVHKERTSGAAAGPAADELVAQISDLERQMADGDDDASASAPSTPTSSPDASPGGSEL